MQRLVRQFRLLFGLYYRPLAAMGEIIDEGSLIFGAICVLLVSAALRFTLGPFGIFTWLIALAAFFVPAGILLAVLFEPVGGFSVVFRRDYGSFLTCALFGWSAANLPMAILSMAGVFNPFVLAVAGATLFAVTMVFAFRTLYAAGWAKCILMTVLSLVSLAACLFLFLQLGGVLRYIASPFILYYLWLAFRGDVGDLSQAFRSRQNFRRLMDAAALNPHDAEPHYQLGLIHQQRRQYAQAIAQFTRAIEIDKTEVDAQFQLGRIAREQGRLDDAIRYLETAAALDPKHSFGEVWREIGATHLAAGRLDAAAAALSEFVERRAYDPEGLYLLGDALSKLGQESQAKEAFQRCVEAVETLPNYRRGLMSKWRKLARAGLKPAPTTLRRSHRGGQSFERADHRVAQSHHEVSIFARSGDHIRRSRAHFHARPFFCQNSFVRREVPARGRAIVPLRRVRQHRLCAPAGSHKARRRRPANEARGPSLLVPKDTASAGWHDPARPHRLRPAACSRARQISPAAACAARYAQSIFADAEPAVYRWAGAGKLR